MERATAYSRTPRATAYIFPPASEGGVAHLSVLARTSASGRFAKDRKLTDLATCLNVLRGLGQ
jgi:hypothetical protein